MRLGRGIAPLAAALAVLALPVPAGAEYIVPPGNSAATQYTEAFPTASGNKGTRASGSRTPQQVLGRAGAAQLESSGPAGAAVAVLTAATAPPGAAPEQAGADGRGGDGGAASGRPLSAEATSGASEAIGQATGGTLIPLVLLAVALWAVLYLWLRRRPDPA